MHSFAEVLGVECRSGSTLELTLKSEQLVLHTARAGAIKAMVELFLRELRKASVGCVGSWAGTSTPRFLVPRPGWLVLGLSAKLPGVG